MDKVIIDIDNTLWDLIYPLIDYYTQNKGDIEYIDPYNGLVDYDLTKDIKPSSWNDFWACLESDDFYQFLIRENVKNKDLIEIFNTLEKLNNNDKYEVYIATSTAPEHVTLKLKYFSMFFWFIDRSQIIIINDKSMLDGDIFIDDNPEVIEKCVDKYKRVIIIDQLWNRYLDKGERIADFTEIRGVLNI